MSDAERESALSLAPSALASLPCGFMAPSAFDEVAAFGRNCACADVVLTAV